MAKPRSAKRDYVVFLVVRMMSCLVQALPLSFSLAMVHGLAWVAYRIDRRHREVAKDNLRHAFPGLYSEKELSRIVLEVYRHFGRMLLEMAWLPRKFQSARWRAELAAQIEHLRQTLQPTGRPLLFVTAHFGSWEIAPFYLAALGIRAHLVARPLDNPYLDASVRQLRECAGHKVLSKHGEMMMMGAVLNAGGILCTLADQDAGHRGMFVDFFGRPASTHHAIGFLAERSNAIIVVIGMQNLGGLFRYQPQVTDIIDVQEYVGKPGALRAIMQRMTTAVETLVRLDPKQYFWLHRRWKHQPPAKQRSAVAA